MWSRNTCCLSVAPCWKLCILAGKQFVSSHQHFKSKVHAPVCVHPSTPVGYFHIPSNAPIDIYNQPSNAPQMVVGSILSVFIYITFIITPSSPATQYLPSKVSALPSATPFTASSIDTSPPTTSTLEPLLATTFLSSRNSRNRRRRIQPFRTLHRSPTPSTSSSSTTPTTDPFPSLTFYFFIIALPWK